MNNIIVEEKYKFVPPRSGTLYPAIVGTLLPWIVRKDYGIASVKFAGLEKLQGAVREGKGVMLTPNHCRPVDPMIVAMGAKKAGCHIYTLASWHLFKQNRWQEFILPRLGVMSIYREGLDREALKYCAGVLSEGRRPLLVFPEGAINRTNDKIGDFLEGIELIARLGAKAREDKEVQIFPVALRYVFEGDFSKTVETVVENLEKRLTWVDQRDKSLRERISNIGYAFLCLKEIEYTGETGVGSVDERISSLADLVMNRHEQEWLGGARKGGVKSRVKALRTAVLPSLLKEGVQPETKESVWRVLRDVYLAQQLDNYSTSYFSKAATTTQLLEAVEKFEEDLTDKVKVHRPFRVTMTICDPVIAAHDGDRNRGVVEKIKSTIFEKLRSDADNLS
jgi:1-acyl-sn-glycerol-3-phosphate acyltransferase